MTFVSVKAFSKVIGSPLFFLLVRMRIVDFDECSGGISDCHFNADCINTEGSYNCTCKPGFVGNGTTCQGKANIE